MNLSADLNCCARQAAHCRQEAVRSTRQGEAILDAGADLFLSPDLVKLAETFDGLDTWLCAKNLLPRDWAR